MTTLASREAFGDELVCWLNRKFASPGRTIGRTTRLFEGGLINSIRILEIIAWVERAIGRTIPDCDVRMDNFASAERIAELFGTEDGHVVR
jgi:acyl carrier protein